MISSMTRANIVSAADFSDRRIRGNGVPEVLFSSTMPHSTLKIHDTIVTTNRILPAMLCIGVYLETTGQNEVTQYLYIQCIIISVNHQSAFQIFLVNRA